MTEARELPKAPDTLAHLTVQQEQNEPIEVVLSEVKTWKKGSLAEGVQSHQDALTTALTPAIEKGDSTIYWLVGYRLHSRENPGDTKVTYSLLLETPPDAKGTVKAVWYEDHYEIPRSFFIGSGSISPGAEGASNQIQLSLKETEYGDELKVQGMLHP